MSDSAPTPPVLQAAQLSKTFRGPTAPVPVLTDATLTLHKGQSLAILGESGSGKTTLLNLLSLLEHPDSGSVHWNGQAVHTLPNSTLAQRRATYLGFIFQAHHLIPELNAFENVLLAARLTTTPSATHRNRAHDLLQRVGLEGRAHHTPAKLSGGERQRVALARALINQPSLLLADEPTGNLDERTGETVMQRLLNLCQEEQTALILVTHNLPFAHRADRRLLLRQGILHPHD